MIANTISAEIRGIEVRRVNIEVDCLYGLPQFSVIGLGDKTIKEAGERIRSAIINSGFQFPLRKITVNLSPAELSKRGSRFDLPMALAILAASGQIPRDSLSGTCFTGELSLDGTIRSCSGVLPIAASMKQQGIDRIMVSKDNCSEAMLVKDLDVVAVENLSQAVEFLKGKIRIESNEEPLNQWEKSEEKLDFFDVIGQEWAKRAIVIAASGNHGLLMTGSPGTGKSMLASRIPGILPDLDPQEFLQVCSIYSTQDMYQSFDGQRPFRKPDCGITRVGIAGGGSYHIKAGEITLAHKGVLFLDEMCQFRRDVLDALRLPMETKQVEIVRNGETIVFPADFLLIGATNPCRCGFLMHPEKQCTCTEAQIRAYRNRIPPPVMDRIDMHIFLPHVEYQELKGKRGMTTADMRKLVENSRRLQQERYRDETFRWNSEIPDNRITAFCKVDEDTDKVLQTAYGKMNLNPRTLGKVMRVARTVSDIQGEEHIMKEHVLEALQYRERIL